MKSKPIFTQQEKALQELGQKIRDRRKELKINSVATAEAAEISRVTLYRIERGEASVAMGAYMSVISALGLSLELANPTDQKTAKARVLKSLPQEISLSKYKQLKRLAWQLKKTKTLSPQEALDIYERNWRHLDVESLDAQEKELIELLLASFGRRRLLV